MTFFSSSSDTPGTAQNRMDNDSIIARYFFHIMNRCLLLEIIRGFKRRTLHDLMITQMGLRMVTTRVLRILSGKMEGRDGEIH